MSLVQPGHKPVTFWTRVRRSTNWGTEYDSNYVIKISLSFIMAGIYCHLYLVTSKFCLFCQFYRQKTWKVRIIRHYDAFQKTLTEQLAKSQQFHKSIHAKRTCYSRYVTWTVGNTKSKKNCSFKPVINFHITCIMGVILKWRFYLSGTK